LGARLEWPFINRIKAGAQNTDYIRKPDIKKAVGLIGRCGPALKVVTIAPEIKGAIPVIKLLKRRNVIASIGHSNATFDEAAVGIKAGISHATHTFNAMRGPDEYDRGASTAVLLSSEVTAEVIADMIHIPKVILSFLIRIKGPDRTILVTDSVRAEGKAKPQDGVYRLGNGTIAGSALTAIKAVENCVKECGISVTEAVRMITLTPARLLGVDGNKGRIAEGMDADIVLFDKDFKVKLTMINGQVVYRNARTRCAA
jgi:N-acetylglucosamine-6-phosphate deacetylase